MAWSRDRVDSLNINGGNEYEKGDRVSRQQLNAMVNSGLYSQDFVEALTEAPTVENNNLEATPTVELVPYNKNGKEFYKFKFKNIKGKDGSQGPAGANGKDGANGESATISNVTAEISTETTDTPSVNVQLGGTSLDRTFHFVFKGILGGGSSGASAKLYEELGSNTDGAMTQKATTNELNKKVEFEYFDEVEFTPSMQTQLNNIQTQVNNIQGNISNNIEARVNSVENTLTNKTEKVEVLYEKSSNNSNINWGITGGILGGVSTTPQKVFTNYKRIRFYVLFKLGQSQMLEMDMNAPITNTTVHKRVGVTALDFDDMSTNFVSVIVFNTSTNNLFMHSGYLKGSTYSQQHNNSDFQIYKIEGVV